jgi:hypothetical protein
MRNEVESIWNAALWSNISGDSIVEFLHRYRTSAKALKVRSSMLADFIDMMMKQGELRKWTVAIPGSGDTNATPLPMMPGIGMIKRSSTAPNDTETYRIGRLVSPRDEGIDLVDDDWKRALELTRKAWKPDPGRPRRQREEPSEPNGLGFRKARQLAGSGAEANGLFLLYPIDPRLTEHKLIKSDTVESVIGIALSFPVSASGAKVPYEVTNVYWEQEYGAPE